MKSKRTQRQSQFKATGRISHSFSQELISGANGLLQLGLDERTRGVWRGRYNHYTAYAPSVVVLVITALDIWLTEYSLHLRPFDESMRRFAPMPTVQRAIELAKLSPFAPPLGVAQDLRMIVDLRDEIVHYLPRSYGENNPLPEWFKPLQDADLLITSGPNVDFDWNQKLGSYRLAYYASEVVDRCVRELVAAAPEDAFVPASLAQNFSIYRRIASPEQLPEFDKRHGITEWHERGHT